MKKKALFALILTLALLAGISSSALTDGPITTQPLIPPTTNPYEYATAPDGLYVFIYRGYCPYFTGELDTSECTQGFLYVHDQEANEIIEITDQNVMGFAASKDALYYLTEDSEVYKSDYTGNTQSLLYQYKDGSLRDLTVYLGMLMMVKDENSLLFVDASTGVSHAAFTGDAIDCYFMLSGTTILITTLDGENLVYDLTLRQVTEDVSEMEANNLINVAVLSAAGQTDPDASIMATISAPPATVQNDITLPLPEYPANIYPITEVANFTHRRPISWFHYNNQEGCSSSNCKSYGGTGECEGFAWYAHDKFLHIQSSSVTYSQLKNNRHLEHFDMYPQSSVQWKQFFTQLKTGDYVRYGKMEDIGAPLDGSHSIIFHSIDAGGLGIWVYECNQKYDSVGVGTHGCGVFFHYYTFEEIAQKYEYVAHYNKHSFTGTKSCLSATSHKIMCAGASVYSALESNNDYEEGVMHQLSCTGYVVSTHTSQIIYSPMNAAKHRVSAACCSGSALEPHNFMGNVCYECGYVKS